MSSAVRVQGRVLKVETRSGVRRDDGEKWSMTTARVLVANEDICDLGIGDAYLKSVEGLLPAAGQDIDVLASVRASKGYLNIDAVKPWPSAPSVSPK